MKTKFLSYAEAGKGFNVAVYDKDKDLPNTFLGTYKHEDAIEPMGPIGFPQLRSHVLSLLRAAHTDPEREINLETVSIRAAYEVLLGDERDELLPAKGLSDAEARDSEHGSEGSLAQTNQPDDLNTADSGGENKGVVQPVTDQAQGSTVDTTTAVNESRGDQANADTTIDPSKDVQEGTNTGTENKSVVEPTIIFAGGTVNVKVGESTKLPVVFEGALRFESDKPEVATVDAEGNVTGVKKGTATVAAQIEGSETADMIEVKVK